MTSVLPRLAHEVVDLDRRTMHTVDDRVVPPRYDRSSLTPAVVHIGVGGFHRAHQAVYLDELARTGETGWGEIGVGLRSPAMRDALVPQDCLYTVVERSGSGDTARIVGAMTRYLYAPDNPEAVLAVLTDARTRLVTLTITGGGYPVGEDGAFDRTDAEVRADLHHPGRPQTAFGYLAEALHRRRQAGLSAFTILSCDNMPDNGAVTRSAVLGYAAARDESLATWIDAHAAFPASMVDRITPETHDRDRDLVAEQFGIRDRWPVITEPFTQWVIEDRFCRGRPPLDKVGVRFVDDVTPYKLMKTRLLNASHSALGYLGYLGGGYATTSEAMANPVIADYLAALMREEITGLLPDGPGIDLQAYQRIVLFANPRTRESATS